VLDLSTNENPFQPLPGVLAAVNDRAGSINSYPDMACAELVAAIAARFSVPPGHVVTGPGAVGVLQQIIQVAIGGRGGEVVVGAPSFPPYRSLTTLCGGAPVEVPLTAGGAHDVPAMLAAINDRTKLVVLCNPNNPTGTVTPTPDVHTLLAGVPDHITVLLDEAYREFVRDPGTPDGLDCYRAHPNVVVLRTFSKAYGLAGLRVGYAFAQEDLARRLRAAALPYGVNSLAEAAAVRSLAVEDALMERVETIVKERERLRAGLLMQGWSVPPSEANFLWLSLPEGAEDVVAGAAGAGLLTKAFPGHGVRVSVGEPDANDAMLRFLGTRSG
jgi:histidinol-phosphate aminotransferase